MDENGDLDGPVGPIARALRSVMADVQLWNSFVEAYREAKGLDHDFPEENYDGPVGRLHRANAKLRNAAVLAEPSLLGDLWAIRRFLEEAYYAVERDES